MSHKIVNVNNPGGITKKQEAVLMKAYEDYADSDEIQVPYRDALGSKHVKGVSCPHVWKPAPAQDDVAVWFRKNFEEDAVDPGEFCAKCGATALRENGKIWAYDGTTRFFGKVPKARRQPIDQ